jgi:hypothetical protein
MSWPDAHGTSRYRSRISAPGPHCALGRRTAASPAPGSKDRHAAPQRAIGRLLGLDTVSAPPAASPARWPAMICASTGWRNSPPPRGNSSSTGGGGTSANLGNSCNRGTSSGWEASNALRDTAEISSFARWRRIATGAPDSPQLATREHVEKRHQRDETEHGPCHLRTASDIPAGGQVNPHQDHGNGMEEADQEFEDLLHCLNLPGPLWVPVRSPPAAPPVVVDVGVPRPGHAA